MSPMSDIQDFLVDSRKYVELYFPMTELILLLPAEKYFRLRLWVELSIWKNLVRPFNPSGKYELTF